MSNDTVKLILAVLICSILISLCACGKAPSETADSTEDTTDSVEKTEDTEPTMPAAPVLDGLADEIYTADGFSYESTPLYIYSSNPEKRKTDENGNSPFCEASGVFRFYFDGTDMWLQGDINDPTMFAPDTDFVLTDYNPWKTDSVEVWWSFDGKTLLHVDTDAYGLRMFTDDKSRPWNMDDIEFAVTNDIENNRYHIEFRIPGVKPDGTPLKSGETVWAALQINDLFTDPAADPSRNNNLASNGGHNISNFKEIVLP